MTKLEFAVLLVLLAIHAGAEKRLELSVDTIMRGPQLSGYEPGDARWSGDSQRIFFRWKQYSDPHTKPLDTYVVNRDGSGLKKLSDDEALQAPPIAADFTRDREMSVY